MGMANWQVTMAYTNGNGKFARYNGLFEWRIANLQVTMAYTNGNGKFAGHNGLYEWK